MSFRILVLGGYGTFGQRICRALAASEDIQVIVAGRNAERARQFVGKLRQQHPDTRLSSAALDVHATDFAVHLQALAADAVIHTCGPFQNQDYSVARACIATRVHYIDLADARVFVSGFSALHRQALQQGVLAVSGASSVPALSAAVVDALLPAFSRLHRIDHGINPGNQTSRGLATVQSILSYCGKSFSVWRNQHWRTVYGWQGLHRRSYPAPMGRRYLGYCDVPDLELFPQRYPGVQDVRFCAGLELSGLHLGTWLASWMTRAGLVDNWAAYAAILKRVSEWFESRGSTRGGMHVELSGIDTEGKPLQRTWYLLADRGDGPQIPCTASVLVAKKLAHGQLTQRGAMPCMGLFTLDEFMQELHGFNVKQSLVTAR